MNCPKCKREVRSDIHICPFCGSLVNVPSKIKQTSSKQNVVKTASKAKSKIEKADTDISVGDTVEKKSFVTLQKKVVKKPEIIRKNYNNYIDYKEAKERAIEEMNKPNSSKTRSILSIVVTKETQDKAGTVAGRTVSKRNSKSGNKNIKVVNKKMAINPLVSDNFNNLDNEVTKDKVQKKAIGIVKTDNYHFMNNLATFIVLILWIGVVYYLVSNPELSYYFHENEKDIVRETSGNTTVDEELIKYEGTSKSGQKGVKGKEGVTSIIYDNQYLKQFDIKDEATVYRLISTDSVKQKKSCSSNITKIENEIITNYGITAVNFCEMDEGFALELKDVIKYIYNNYPSARNYLTNITLANVEPGVTYMAAFMPVFTFATSSSNTGYPVGVKSQIILNAAYFLNKSKINSSVSYGAKTGYFPKNATRSSSVAHEFGHYLSYIALLNHYNSHRLVFVKANQSKLLYDIYQDFNEGSYTYDLLVEAYNEYHKVHTNTSFDDFRASISKYAMAKDTSGKYIYDETVAEAFHDVYLNGNNAEEASKYIVDILVSKI